MYILEVFVKWLNKRQTKDVIPSKPTFDEVDEALTCEHNFMSSAAGSADRSGQHRRGHQDHPLLL